jgi:hypothetical protein
MKIYVNGDSFTDGDGLADAETFPGMYPGHHYLHKGFIVNRRWSNTRHDMLSSDLSLWTTYRNNNRKYVWATILGELVGATVVNNAVGGSCMTGIATRTIADLSSIHSRADLPDYVFIGLTMSDRLGWHDKEHIENIDQVENWIKTAIPAFKDRMLPEHYEKMFMATWSTLSDEELLINYLKECLQIKNYVKRRIGRDPIFLNTSYQFCDYKKIVNSSKNQWLRMLWFDLLEFDKINDRWFNSGTFDILTACGHAVPEVHSQFARDIAREHFGWGKSPVDKDA